MPAHLVLDAAKGALLASWLPGFAENGPHCWLTRVLAAATSKTD